MKFGMVMHLGTPCVIWSVSKYASCRLLFLFCWHLLHFMTRVIIRQIGGREGCYT